MGRTIVVILTLVASSGADWPRFRGPNGQGRGEADDLPATWSEDANIVWKTPLPGKGWSSPVVSGKQIWMTAAMEEGRSLRALCVDRQSGKLIHNVEVFAPKKPSGINERNTHASPTPAIEGGRIYVHFGNMGTACLATETGDVLWRTTDLHFKLTHGPASSPILFRNLVILQFDGPQEKLVVALNKRSGEVVWQRHRSAPYRENTLNHQAHTTPVVAKFRDRWQLITVAADQTHAYDPLTGDELWHVRYEGFANVACPILSHPSEAQDSIASVYVLTGFGRTELWKIRLDGEGDVTESRVLWRARKQMPKLPTPVLADGRIYLVNDQGVASSLDAETGERLWETRLGGNFSASPVFGDGKLYFASEIGDVTVVQVGEKPTIVGKNKLPGAIKATPAIADRAIYLRTEHSLYRIEKATPAPVEPTSN